MDSGEKTFCIVCFSNADFIDGFLNEASKVGHPSIHSRRGPVALLIVTRGSDVSDEEWTRYLGMGFKGAFGSYAKHWYETDELRLEAIYDFEKQEVPFAEVYSGGDCRLISTSDENDLT